MSYMLEHLTVIDAASFLAGPGAATVMADYGANVIKIEPPQGDGYRTLVGRYPVPYHWLLTSRNKRSVGLNLRSQAGQQVVHKLIESADVIVVNFLDDQLKGFGLDYETVRAINPRIIFAQMTGYGSEGPDAHRKAFDVTGWWARTGLMEFVRDPGQTPIAMAPGQGDHASAMSVFGAIMAGLYRREKTGDGCRVSTSLVANGVWANGMALQGVVAGTDAGEFRQEHGWGNPFTYTYESADKRFVVLAVINIAKEWPGLLRALELESWAEDERFRDPRTIMRNRAVVLDGFAEAIRSKPLDETMAAMDAHGVTFSYVQPMAEVLTDPQMLANDVIVPTGDEVGDYDLTVGSPIQIEGEPKRPPSRAPDIGAQSREVLAEFGFAESAIDGLIADGVVVAAGDDPSS